MPLILGGLIAKPIMPKERLILHCIYARNRYPTILHQWSQTFLSRRTSENLSKVYRGPLTYLVFEHASKKTDLVGVLSSAIFIRDSSVYRFIGKSRPYVLSGIKDFGLG